MLRKLRILLAALLVPLVILSTPRTASAAAGDWAGVTWQVEGFDAGPVELMKFDCGASFSIGQVTGGYTIYHEGGWCTGGYDTSPGFCAIGELPCTSISYTFNGAGGCPGLTITPTLSVGPNDGFRHTDLRTSPANVYMAQAQACDPSEICITISADVFGSDSEAWGCASISLDLPVPVEDLDGCADGKPSASPTYSMVDTDPWGGPWYGYEQFTVTAPMNLDRAAQVQVLLWYTIAGTRKIFVFDTKTIGPGLVNYTAEATGAIDDEEFNPARTQVGVQVVIRGPSTSGWNNGLGWNYNVLTQGPPDTDMGAANWPERCSFYWGHKYAATSADDHDEPIGDIGTMPSGPTGPGGTPTEPPTAEPEPTDEMGWLETLAGALEALARAIGGLIGAMLEMLKDLFIPDPSSWDFAGVKTQFEQRPPGSVMADVGTGMTSFGDAYAGAGGCGLIADFSSEDISAPITCSAVSSVPGYGALYGLVQLGMLALTGLGLFRMFAGVMGGDK